MFHSLLWITDSIWHHFTNLDNSWLGKVESYNRGKSCSPMYKASLVVGFHKPASTNHTWNLNRTTFWTFCFHQSIRTALSFHECRSVSLLRTLPKFHVDQRPRVSISFVKIALQSYVCIQIVRKVFEQTLKLVNYSLLKFRNEAIFSEAIQNEVNALIGVR